jgi:hypothetical protein
MDDLSPVFYPPEPLSNRRFLQNNPEFVAVRLSSPAWSLKQSEWQADGMQVLHCQKETPAIRADQHWQAKIRTITSGDSQLTTQSGIVDAIGEWHFLFFLNGPVLPFFI